MLNDFCAFILTHGRPDNVVTYNTLRKHGYTGKIYLVVDNMDKTITKYNEIYKNEVIVFDKNKAAEYTDCADNSEDMRAVIFARNACFGIAKSLGYTYFIVLDDDYVDFRYKLDDKFNNINKVDIKNLDSIFSIMLDYYKTISALSIAFAQGGDFLGGKDGNAASHPQFRKCMNSFICSTERPFKFYGRINEDTTAYTYLGTQGKLFLTIPNIALQQKATQKNKGGLTDIYLANGTYVKSFYTVIFAPSCSCVKMMISNHPRLHHSIAWNNAVPKIISEDYRKK